MLCKGVPWNVIFGDDYPELTNAERVAFLIMIGEADGGEFDWQSLSWKERK